MTPFVGQSMNEGQRAVIDVGSNSVRLVIYDGPRRAPFSICNEKALCGLGRRMTDDGRLDPEATRDALDTLTRFRRILDDFGNPPLRAVATAAVREATNGAEFVRWVKDIGFDLEVIDGAREAELAALGVVSFEPEANGIVGDLGGGSLELVCVKNGGIGKSTSLPLGALRVMEVSNGKLNAALAYVESELSGVKWLGEENAGTLYTVGGAWRALAKIHMQLRNHPLSVLHHYDLPAKDVIGICDLVARQSRTSLEEIQGVSRRRIETLPFAAAVLKSVIKHTRAPRVFVSAGGVREGLLYDDLEADDRQLDPLMEGVSFFAHRFSPSPDVGRVVSELLDGAFEGETPGQARVRVAASKLIDIGAFFHPDLRAQQAFDTALRAPFSGIGHEERAFIALALFVRHKGSKATPPDPEIVALLSDADRLHAVRIGLALRFAAAFSPKMHKPLIGCKLEPQGPKLVFSLPANQEVFVHDGVRRRLEALAQSMDLTAVVNLMD